MKPDARAKDVGERLKERILQTIFPQLAQGFLADRLHRLGVKQQPTEEELQDTFAATLTLLYRLLFLIYAESRELLPVREAAYHAVSLTRLKEEISERAGADKREVATRLAQVYSLQETTIYDQLLRLFTAIDCGDSELNVPAHHGGLFAQSAPHKVPDRYLSLAIDQLARDSVAESSSLIFIDYESLEIRHLGSIYEGLLESKLCIEGVVRLTVDKSERKASGSYYTPDAIVEYIVASSVGPVLEEKLASWRDDAHDIEQLFDFHVLDPAMGTGHFLVEAVNFITARIVTLCNQFPVNPLSSLLDQSRSNILTVLHEQGVAIDPAKLTEGNLLKRLVLERCIYGVDLNPMAVELAKTCLWLDACAIGAPLSFLDHHLHCGNSLIGATFKDLGYLPVEEEVTGYRVVLDNLLTERFGLAKEDCNFFHWEVEFPEVFPRHQDKQLSPGFDAIFGNPPYLSYSGRQGEKLVFRNYFNARYGTDRWPSLHGLFIKRALQLSRDAVSLIIPDQVGHLDGYEDIRIFITQHAHLQEVRYWGEDVFEHVVTPCLTFIARKAQKGATMIRAIDGTCRQVLLLGGARWTQSSAHEDILRKIQHGGVSLGQWVGDPGVHTGNCSEQLIVPLDSGPDVVPILEGKQVSRYSCMKPVVGLQTNYQKRGDEYFTIRPLATYQSARFVIRQTAAYPIVGARRYADYFRNSLLALYDPDADIDVRYLVGLLNSQLMRFVYQQTVQESAQKAFPQVKVRALRSLPIRLPGSDSLSRSIHDEIVALVAEMLSLQGQAGETKDAQDIWKLITALDERIDRIVFSIYQLSDNEIEQIKAALR